jgi:phage tail-like protein
MCARLIAEPEHDPLAWRLDGRTGWRLALPAPQIAAGAGPGAVLELAPLPGGAASLSAPDGSFGGLVLPRHVAIDSGGAIYLLDERTAELKRFDLCDCVFRALPAIAGRGSGARRIIAPGGIAIRGTTLYVCDRGGRRLLVFALPGLALRAIWVPPAPYAATWAPAAVAFDARAIYVADAANGRVHRFAHSGRWLDPPLPALPDVSALAVDCDGRLYALGVGPNGAPQAALLGPDGAITPLEGPPAALARRFPPTPLRVDRFGNLRLDDRCPGGPAAFDTQGAPLRDAPAETAARHREGATISGPLDSAIHRCVWHRVELRASIPQGALVRVGTYSAEVEQPAEVIAGLPAQAWSTGQVARGLEGDWDCLVRGEPGRFLWLRLELIGDGEATPRIESARVEYPRIGLSRFLPPVFTADPVNGEFTDRFLAIFDSTLRSIEAVLDDQARLFDPGAAPADTTAPGGDALGWLATWIGLTLDRHLPAERRRGILRAAARLYHIRGTREGLRRQILLLLGMGGDGSVPGGCRAAPAPPACTPAPANCAPPEERPAIWEPPQLILEHFHLRRWLFLGAGRLGAQAALFGSDIVNRSRLDGNARVERTQLITSKDPQRDLFHHYAHRFTVFVPAWVERAPSYRRGLLNLLRADSPADAQATLRYVAPRFRIGVQATIGFDAVVGCYPQGVHLGDTALGPASVLSGPPGRTGDEPAVGRTLRIGGARL